VARVVDRRQFNLNRATPAREQELAMRASGLEGTAGLTGGAELPALTIESVDPLTGNAAVIRFAPQAPTGGLVGEPDFVAQALAAAQSVAPALGLAPELPAEFAPDPNVQETSGQGRAVHLHQQHQGIPVFQAAQAVRFRPNGMLSAMAGRSITLGQDLDPVPQVSVEQATLQAAQFVAVPGDDERGLTDQFAQPAEPPSVDLTGFQPRTLSSFDDRPERPAVLEAGPFAEPITASLIWFPLDETTIRLAWEVILTFPERTAQYRTLVAADDGEILYSQQLVQNVRARGSVHVTNGGEPRQMIEFPVPVESYNVAPSLPLPQGFPIDWVEANATTGNAVFAHLGETPQTATGMAMDGATVFNPQPQSDDQRILNVFFFCNLMHDFFYLLGFREGNGNFQQVNVGSPGDRVDARVFPGPVPMTASMFTPVDGSSPTMKMGLVTTPAPGRHTALDATVVFHEYTHGVTNRLVGGPLNVHALDAPQCRGMGEGWSDYIACTVMGTSVVAAWATANPAGIRKFRYDASFPAQTENFGRLGTDRYTVEHTIGELWCATLMEMNRNIGDRLALQLVIDALMLSPANPSFLDMRDAILDALTDTHEAGRVSDDQHATALAGIWRAFAKFGMGPAAQCNGPFLQGIRPDFTVPSDLPAPAVAAPVQPVTTSPTPVAVSPVTSPTAPLGEQPGLRVETPADFTRDIPDADANGVTSTLRFSPADAIARVAVSIRIEHPVVQDLLVTLGAPDGRTAVLHDRAEGPANLVKTFTSEDTPTLAGLVGGPAQGDWTLKVADHERKDVGRLQGWSLELGLGAPVRTGGLVADAPGVQMSESGNRLDLRLDFPDERAQEAFRLAFTGWLLQYRQRAQIQALLQRGLTEAHEYLARQGRAGSTGTGAVQPGGPQLPVDFNGW
jgi:extracellular elastinolytic metalloproteinase